MRLFPGNVTRQAVVSPSSSCQGLPLDALSDDVLGIILSEMDVASLCTAGSICTRLRALAADPHLWRRMICAAMTAAHWRVQPHQLGDIMALRRIVLRSPSGWVPPSIVVHAESSRRLSISPDSASVRYVGERLGGNRAARADPPLPTKPCDLVRASWVSGALGEGETPHTRSVGEGGVRFDVIAQCTVSYFEVTIGDQARGATAQPLDCVAIGLASHDFPLNGRQPGWDGHSFGYHSDDGRLFHGSGTRSRAAWSTFTAGDTVGCGFCVVSRQIFYTLNGQYLGVAFTAKAHQVTETQPPCCPCTRSCCPSPAPMPTAFPQL